MYYMCRKVNAGKWELTKWEEGNTMPSDIYVVFMGSGDHWKCSCPSMKRPCKHVAMIKAFDRLQPIDAFHTWVLTETADHWEMKGI